MAFKNIDDLSNEIDSKDKEILKVSDYLDIVSEQIYKIRREIVNKELELDTLRQDFKKARFNMNKLKIEKGMIEREFWRNKNG